MTMDPQKLFTEGLQKIRAEDFKGAVERFSALNAQFPNTPDVLSFLGFSEAALGVEKASAKTGKAVEAAPQNPQFLMNHAFALEKAGDIEGACRSVEEANRQSPHQATVIKQLGRLQVSLGRFEEGYKTLQGLIAENLKDPLAVEAFFTALVKLEKKDEAFKLVEALSGVWPKGEGLLYFEARAARLAEDWPRAEKLYSRLVDLNPERIVYKRGLSHALLGLEKFNEVVPLLKDIRAHDPTNERVAYSMAYALFNDHRHEECLPIIDKYLEKHPDHLEGLLIKGRSLAFFGELEDAKEIFNKVLEMQPDHPLAIMQLVKINRPKARDENFRLLEKMDRDFGDNGEFAPLVGYTLGEMFEGLGDFDNAFINFKKGNDRAKAKYASHGFVFDEARVLEEMEGIKTVYSKENLAALKGAGSDSARPIFIVAMPRSGTTLLEQIVSSHSRVYGAGELPFGSGLVATVREAIGEGASDKVVSHLKNEGEGLAQAYLDRLSHLDNEADFVSDKMPANFKNLGLLQSIFPKAKFIHIKRNPLDVCLSNYKGFFSRYFTYAVDLEHLGIYYRNYFELMDYWRGALAQPLYEVVYEDLVENPEAEAKKLLDYIGLDWEEECLDYHTRKNKVVTMSAFQVRKPVHKKSVEKWRNYEKHLGPLLKGLGDDIVKGLKL